MQGLTQRPVQQAECVVTTTVTFHNPQQPAEHGKHQTKSVKSTQKITAFHRIRSLPQSAGYQIRCLLPAKGGYQETIPNGKLLGTLSWLLLDLTSLQKTQLLTSNLELLVQLVYTERVIG